MSTSELADVGRREDELLRRWSVLHRGLAMLRQSGVSTASVLAQLAATGRELRALRRGQPRRNRPA